MGRRQSKLSRTGESFDWEVMGKKETAFLTEPLFLSKFLTDIH